MRRAAAVYPRHDSDLVSCHNDLKPDNILFDGRRVWLVDWEASLLNDRYFDLAIIANFVVTDDAEEGIFLGEYFGQTPVSTNSRDSSSCVRCCTCYTPRCSCCSVRRAGG